MGNLKMSEVKIRNVEVDALVVNGVVAKDGIIELTIANGRDFEVDGEKFGTFAFVTSDSTPIFYKQFEKKKSKLEASKAIPDEKSFDTMVERLQYLGVDTSVIEKEGYDSDKLQEVINDALSSLSENMSNMVDSDDGLPKMFLTVNDKTGEVKITFDKAFVQGDSVKESSNYLNNMLDNEKITVKITDFEENERFGRLEPYFDVNISGETRKLRISQFEYKENEDDMDEAPQVFKLSYAPFNAMSEQKAINELPEGNKMAELRQKALDKKMEQGREQAYKDFERIFGHSLAEVLENNTPMQVRIKQVKNPGKDTAHIVADKVEFLG